MIEGMHPFVLMQSSPYPGIFHFPIKADHLGNRFGTCPILEKDFSLKIVWFLCSGATRQFCIVFWNTLGRFEYVVGPKQAFLFWAAYAGPLLVDSSTQF